jgi:hypothetical protein
MRYKLFPAVCVLTLAIAAPAASAGPGDDAAHLTIYYAGVAEFLEQRSLELQPGTNVVSWRGLMPKAFVRTIRVVAEGAEVVRQDVTYDGPEVRSERSPVLHLTLLNRGAAGPKRVMVDYLAPNLQWQGDYALVLEPTAGGAPPTAASLDSWVSVYNNTGVDVSAGTVDLVAGDISLLVGDGPRQSGEYTSQQRMTTNVVSLDYSESIPIDAAADSDGLSAFSRFTLGRNLSMNANSAVNRFPLFQRARLVIEQRNVFENAYNTQTLGRGGFILLPQGLEVRVVSKNTTGVPMPAGQVTIYAQSGDSARAPQIAQVVGQDRVGLTPQGGEFSVSQGRSATLLGTRKVVERQATPYRTTQTTRDQLTTKIEVTIANRGPAAADAWVRDGIEPFGDNDWTVSENTAPFERLGSNTIQFKVRVPAGGKTTVTYTVVTR